MRTRIGHTVSNEQSTMLREDLRAIYVHQCKGRRVDDDIAAI